MVAVSMPLAMIASDCLASPVQGNPFEDASNDTTSVAVDPADDTSEGGTFKLTLDNQRSDVGLVVRSIRSQDPQSPAELAAAVSTLIDIEAWGDAKVYLDQLNKVVMNDKELYELYKIRGPEFFYILHSIDQLAPESRQLAKRVLSAARNYANSAPRIDQIVKTLADKDINVRSAAFRQIKSVGPPAYAAMLEVFADDSKSDLWPGVRGAVRRLGNDATEVLIAGATSGNRRIEVESYFGLANLDSREAIDLITYLYLSPKTPSNVRTFAEAKVRDYYGGSFNSQQLTSQLSIKANELLRGQQKNADSDAMVSVWQFDETSKTFKYNRVSLAVASRIRAAKLAGLLYEIDPADAQNRQLFLLASIESEKKQVGPDAPIVAQAILKKLGNPDAGELDRLLGEALDRDLITAAIGICELLKEVGDMSLLSSGSGHRPLVRAVLTGERHLQFAALDAIIKIDPQTAYPGSTYVVELAAFLARTQGRSGVLVGHYASPDTRTFEGIVSSTGIGVESVRNGLQFFNQATSSPDWKLLLLTDNLLRPQFGQVVQMLRADWRTRYLPIGIVVSNEKNRRFAQRLAKADPLIKIIDLNFDTKIVNSQLSLFDGLASSWEVSDASRVIHAAVAGQWLGKLAADSDQYRFYNVRKFEDSIFRMLYLVGQTKQASSIASNLGTPRSQRELLNYASQNGQSLEKRVVVADAFAASVKKFGVLLTTDEIEQQYERYNSSATEPKEVQAVFGSLLDSIESKRKAARSRQASSLTR